MFHIDVDGLGDECNFDLWNSRFFVMCPRAGRMVSFAPSSLILNDGRTQYSSFSS